MKSFSPIFNQQEIRQNEIQFQMPLWLQHSMQSLQKQENIDLNSIESMVNSYLHMLPDIVRSLFLGSNVSYLQFESHLLQTRDKFLVQFREFLASFAEKQAIVYEIDKVSAIYIEKSTARIKVKVPWVGFSETTNENIEDLGDCQAVRDHISRLGKHHALCRLFK